MLPRSSLARLSAAPLALICALPLMACADSPPVPPPVQIRVERVTVPAELLTCQAAPPVPDARDQAEVADYVVDLWAAGDDCRAKVRAIRQWAAP